MDMRIKIKSATGFVVDAEKGYIMTNRHVACAGPFWGYCIFDNHEEVSDYAA
jgi:pro-apoptotic serine protease NMA111